jgi:hypothetical protein
VDFLVEGRLSFAFLSVLQTVKEELSENEKVEEDSDT